MSEFTKGPWKLGASMHPMGYDDALWSVCIGGRNTECEFNEADARLIAAAPELYEACRLLLGALEGNSISTSELKAARAAIAKVEER